MHKAQLQLGLLESILTQAQAEGLSDFVPQTQAAVRRGPGDQPGQL